jgi:hypothetical protein
MRDGQESTEEQAPPNSPLQPGDELLSKSEQQTGRHPSSEKKSFDWELENRRFAKKINSMLLIHGLYGALDGLSLSYSMINYVISVACTENLLNPTDEMHDFLETPDGLISTAIESITIIAFSLMANIFKDDDNNAFKRYIAVLWPYFRDAMKGVKNAYKGVRSALQAVGKIGVENLNHMIVPGGIALGLLSLANRFFMRRYVVEPRKDMMKDNETLLLQVQSHSCFLRLNELPKDTSALINHYLLIGDALYYVDTAGLISSIDINDNQFFADLALLYDQKNKNAALELSADELNEIMTKNGGHKPPIATKKYYLHHLEERPSDTEINNYLHHYLFIDNGLYYVQADGSLLLITIDDINVFYKHLVNKQKNVPLYLSLDESKEFITKNTGHLAPPVSIETYRERIKYQSHRLALGGKVGAAYSGVVDGMYLFMGGLSLTTAFVPPVFIMLLVFSSIYVALCLITRFYEEHEYGRRLESTQVRVELALCGREIKEMFLAMQVASESVITAEEVDQPGMELDIDADEQIKKQQQQQEEKESKKRALYQLLSDKMIEFDAKKQKLSKLVTLSYGAAVLDGLKNGLAAYSALSSIMFAISIGFLLAAAPFPPAILLAFIVSGLGCLIAFTSYSLAKTHKHHQQNPKGQDQLLSDPNIKAFCDGVKKRQAEARSLEPTESVKENILSGIVTDPHPSPQLYVQEWMEVIRSWFSGLGKARNVANYTCNPLQEMSEQGHYRDSAIIMWVTGIGAAIYAAVLAIRAYAKGLSRDPFHKPPKDQKKTVMGPKVGMSKLTTIQEDEADTPSDGDVYDGGVKPIDFPPPRPDSVPPASSWGGRYNLFRKSGITKAQSSTQLAQVIPAAQELVPLAV